MSPVEERGISATVLAAILIGLGISGGIAWYVLTLGYGTTLTPARNLVGTWKTSFPVTFYIQTDFDGMASELQDVASEERMVTWIITEGDSENTVYIEQRFTSSNWRSYVTPENPYYPSTGYVPNVSPSFLTGIISGTRLTVMSGNRIVGEFSFTSDIIHGTWDDSETILFSRQRVYTAPENLILTRV